MKLNEKALVYIPKNKKVSNNKILCIAAHQDDIELFAYAHIHKAKISDYSFIGVVSTDGRNSPRTGKYKDYDDNMMILERQKEQKNASEIGNYEAQIMLNYTSSEIKDKINHDVIDDYIEIIKHYQPISIVTHNLADKHPTHVGVVIKLIKALRELNYLPKEFLGIEVWRDLDWVNEEDKVILDCGENKQEQLDLLNVFPSQTVGGKRYDLAGVGRRYANATFNESHAVDTYKMSQYAIDLLPLLIDKNLDISEYIIGFIDRFKNDVKKMINDLD